MWNGLNLNQVQWLTSSPEGGYIPRRRINPPKEDKSPEGGYIPRRRINR